MILKDLLKIHLTPIRARRRGWRADVEATLIKNDQLRAYGVDQSGFDVSYFLDSRDWELIEVIRAAPEPEIDYSAINEKLGLK